MFKNYEISNLESEKKNKTQVELCKSFPTCNEFLPDLFLS